MFKKEEIEFMNIYVSLLYKKGYCYFDISKEYLDSYLHELRKIIEVKKYNYLENIFKFDEIMNNYPNFINLILYVTECPKYSFEDNNANIIMINYNNEIIENNLKNIKYNNINIVDNIVDYMINYINQNIKIKIISR